ncbi:hypothetical protein FO519_009051 [Halicephalobus sp. NKZ332]|nr:hypothetical protein FO519_009051 [Halicephalobus sp. NKZ332]
MMKKGLLDDGLNFKNHVMERLKQEEEKTKNIITELKESHKLTKRHKCIGRKRKLQMETIGDLLMKESIDKDFGDYLDKISKLKERIYLHQALFQPRFLFISLLTVISVVWTANTIMVSVNEFISSVFGPHRLPACPYYFQRDTYCEAPLPLSTKRMKSGEAFLGEFCGNGISITFGCDSYFEACQAYPIFGGLKLVDQDDLRVSCFFIKDRQYLPSKPLTPEESEFPIAFVKTVKRDYYFLEMELAATYAPQNVYCFSIDRSATSLFKERMKNLTECLPNVYIGTREYDIGGNDELYAYLNCVKKIMNHKWKYAIFLGNHDVAMKTNAEIVAILKMFNGSNDIPIEGLPSYVLNGDWSFRGIQLMENSFKNTAFKKLQLAQGDLQSTWSRKAMEFIVNEINFSFVPKRFENETTYGMKRVFLNSLQASDDVELPGGFTNVCLNRGFGTKSITRFVYYLENRCESGIIKNGICVGGRSNLRFLDRRPEMFFSLMDPQLELVAYHCWRERMFNRTYLPERSPPEETLKDNLYQYVNHTTVRLNRERLNSSFTLEDFHCE